MPLYSIDVQLIATAYIRAKDAAEAKRIANLWAVEGASLYTDGSEQGAVEISSAPYADLPHLSLSPAMTMYGTHPKAEAELVEE